MPQYNSAWKNLLPPPGSENIIGTRRRADLCDNYVESFVENKMTDLNSYVDLSATAVDVEFSNSVTFEQFIQLFHSIVV
jgi:hypothetical protein